MFLYLTNTFLFISKNRHPKCVCASMSATPKPRSQLSACYPTPTPTRHPSHTHTQHTHTYPPIVPIEHRDQCYWLSTHTDHCLASLQYYHQQHTPLTLSAIPLFPLHTHTHPTTNWHMEGEGRMPKGESTEWKGERRYQGQNRESVRYYKASE